MFILLAGDEARETWIPSWQIDPEITGASQSKETGKKEKKGKEFMNSKEIMIILISADFSGKGLRRPP